MQGERERDTHNTYHCLEYSSQFFVDQHRECHFVERDTEALKIFITILKVTAHAVVVVQTTHILSSTINECFKIIESCDSSYI